MPHVIVKLWPGKSDTQKQRLADAITQNVTSILGYGDDAVSVAFEEVASADWTEQVFEPDILGKWDQLAKEPGYGPRPGQARS
ncbi:tautomerase family protein [Sphingomonas sp. ac-8]|uniref:tautomerase family protein n=1 Tax=Sphingomonas sp. ac-8 TaxID=3242977 RepID=UPI003A810FAE